VCERKWRGKLINQTGGWQKAKKRRDKEGALRPHTPPLKKRPRLAPNKKSEKALARYYIINTKKVRGGKGSVKAKWTKGSLVLELRG
jgi:hypothetical protein